MKKLVYSLFQCHLLVAAENSSKVYMMSIMNPLTVLQATLLNYQVNLRKITGALDALINSFSGNIEKRWGSKGIKIAGKSNYVKYIDNYLSRSEVNFSKGQIIVETVSPTDPKQHLKKCDCYHSSYT